MNSNSVQLAALAVTFALACPTGCNRPPPPVPAPPPEVATIAVTPQDVSVYQEWIGTLDGMMHAHVHPQATGFLVAIIYREGSLVKKGEPMFEIDPRPSQAILDQALAKLGKSELDVKRLTPLAKENAVSQEELDDAVQAFLADKAAVEQA